MYDIIYDEMVDAGVAEKLDTPVFFNQEGEIVEEFNRFGKKLTQNLLTQSFVSLLTRLDVIHQ